MKLSDAGLEALKKMEGFRAHAYQDSGGVWSVGFGHAASGGHSVPQTVTRAEAEALLLEDVREAEHGVNNHRTAVLTQGQFDCLVCFVFNVGEQNFANSTLLKRLNALDYDAIPTQLRRWIHVGREVNQGLMNRREAEIKLWLS